MTMNREGTTPEGTKSRRFTVLWKMRGRDRRSAQMTEIEAQRFVERLTNEKAEAVRIDDDAPAYVPFRAI